jgi:hypothetical protein
VIVNSGVTRGLKLPCSDAAARGLAHRRLLWQKRLADAGSIYAALNIYEAAAGSCEIAGWKDQRVFLQLLHERVATEGEIAVLLGHFAGENDARSYLARGLMRRLVDPALLPRSRPRCSAVASTGATSIVRCSWSSNRTPPTSAC